MSRLMTGGHGPLPLLGRRLTAKPVLAGSQISSHRFKRGRDSFGLPISRAKPSQYFSPKGSQLGEDVLLDANGILRKETVRASGIEGLDETASHVGYHTLKLVANGWLPNHIFDKRLKDIDYVRKVNTVLGSMKSKYPVESDDIAFLEDETLFCSLCHYMGTNLMSSGTETHMDTAILVWNIACRGKFAESAVALARKEYQERPKRGRSKAAFTASEEAWSVVRGAALDGGHWEASYLYADSLLGDPRSTRKDLDTAYRLAQQLVFSDTKPGSATIDGSQRLPEWEYSSWKLLLTAIKKQGTSDPEAFKIAYEIGARQYDDPEACFLLALTLAKENLHKQNEATPKDWVELMTKAAMANQPKREDWGPFPRNAAEELGRYYLKLHGFYPVEPGTKTRKDLIDPASSAGFEWLNVAIDQYLVESKFVLRPLRAIATVLRENGFPEKGEQALLDTRQRIVEASKVSRTSSQGHAEAVRLIDNMLRTWDTTPLLARDVFEPVGRRTG